MRRTSSTNKVSSLPDGDAVLGEGKARDAGGQNAMELLCELYGETTGGCTAERSLRRATNRPFHIPFQLLDDRD